MPENALSTFVQPGDYITYNPTLGVTNQSLLSYTSPVGTLKIKNSSNEYVVNEEGTSTRSYNRAYNLINENGEFITTGNIVESDVQGNGNNSQIYAATANYSLWRVLDVNTLTGVVKIIPDTPILTTTSVVFYLRGLRGYKNAATELNNISSLFGYGQGANGAKSITIEEVNKLTGYTVTPPNSTTLVENIGNWYNTAYYYTKDDSLEDKIKSMIFKNQRYIFASPCVQANYQNVRFHIYYCRSDGIYFADGYFASNASEQENQVYGGVMPVVSLRSDVVKLGGTGESGSPWTFQVTE